MVKNYNSSVCTKIRTDKKKEDNTCPIYIQVIIDRRVKKLTLKGELINVDNWDKTVGRAKGKGYKPLNDLLDKKEQDVKDFIRTKKTNNEMPTFEEISNFWNGVKKSNDDFFEFYDDFCKRHFAVNEIAESTQVHYTTLRKKLKGFKPNLKFSMIDLTLMEDFKTHLEKTKSGRYNMIKFFKTVLKRAENSNLLKDNSWKLIKNPVAEKEPQFLSKVELKVLKELDLNDEPLLNEVRDMFLFSCFTGARHSDVIRFTKKHIKGGVIKFKQRKTKTITATPMLPEALNIIKKYIPGKAEDEPLFTPLSNSHTNRILKKVITKAKLKREFSYHISRHTCASILHQSGIDLITISKMLGHKKPLQTFNYSHTNAKIIKEKIQNVKFT